MRKSKLLLIILIAASVLPTDAFADYQIIWSTIDGGGGTSSGGQYMVSGTIGQHDAAYSAGSSYELLGGFWPGAPLCFVEFDDFARFAEHWLESGSDLPADLDGSGYIDLYDLEMFVYDWLCYCPYNWPLR
jgi:hypothetical protein